MGTQSRSVPPCPRLSASFSGLSAASSPSASTRCSLRISASSPRRCSTGRWASSASRGATAKRRLQSAMNSGPVLIRCPPPLMPSSRISFGSRSCSVRFALSALAVHAEHAVAVRVQRGPMPRTSRAGNRPPAPARPPRDRRGPLWRTTPSDGPWMPRSDPPPSTSAAPRRRPRPSPLAHLDVTSPVSAYQCNDLTRQPFGGTLLDMA